MPGGRPSKYNDELLEKAHEYLLKYKELGHTIPSHAGLAVYLDVRRETLYAWGSDDAKPEFSNILQKILETQELELVSNGLSGDFNAAITKLVLGKHGYHEKQDNTHSGPDGKPIEIDQEWRVQVVE